MPERRLPLRAYRFRDSGSTVWLAVVYELCESVNNAVVANLIRNPYISRFSGEYPRAAPNLNLLLLSGLQLNPTLATKEY